MRSKSIWRWTRISRRTSTWLKPGWKRFFWMGCSLLMQSLNWWGGQESVCMFTPTKYNNLQEWWGSLGAVLRWWWSWHLWEVLMTSQQALAIKTRFADKRCSWRYSRCHAATSKWGQSSAQGEFLNRHHLLQVQWPVLHGQRLCETDQWDEYLEIMPRDVSSAISSVTLHQNARETVQGERCLSVPSPSK